MNILVANDDGIQARGIAELAKALSKAGNVYVAAPNSQRSASSHALSVNDEITMKKLTLKERLWLLKWEELLPIVSNWLFMS